MFLGDPQHQSINTKSWEFGSFASSMIFFVPFDVRFPPLTMISNPFSIPVTYFSKKRFQQEFQKDEISNVIFENFHTPHTEHWLRLNIIAL